MTVRDCVCQQRYGMAVAETLGFYQDIGLRRGIDIARRPYLLRNTEVAAQSEGGRLAPAGGEEAAEPGADGAISSGSNKLFTKKASPSTARNPPTPNPMRGSPVRAPSSTISPTPT